MNNIQVTEFGKLANGQSVSLFTLKNNTGITAQFINYGATLISLKTPDKNGQLDEIVLGFANLDDYLQHEFYFGCVVGRVTNRISHGRFSYNNKTYQLPINFIQQHHIHGGLKGFDKVLWQAKIIPAKEPTIEFNYLSPDGEEGYPGNSSVTVTYTLTGHNELKLNYQATTDQPTPIDLTNHTYWNLAGAGKQNVLQHELQIAADQYIVTDENHIPSGEMRSLTNSAYDFRILKRINADWQQLKNGYDVCYVLLPNNQQTRYAAKIIDPVSGRSMELYTNQNGLQFYTGNYLYDYPIAGQRKTTQYGGFCFETQNFPDAINHANFPSPILLPGEKYIHETVFKFE